ncbi:unnamed protein product [Toxocara canis]|uniref:Uncharacterized protein n=1 Tax=Toxocara canis TaxID=6265 RepID=A0A183VB68_TOXCA|nr:unnamed protein product [Toxocara canis]
MNTSNSDVQMARSQDQILLSLSMNTRKDPNELKIDPIGCNGTSHLAVIAPPAAFTVPAPPAEAAEDRDVIQVSPSLIFGHELKHHSSGTGGLNCSSAEAMPAHISPSPPPGLPATVLMY